MFTQPIFVLSFERKKGSKGALKNGTLALGFLNTHIFSFFFHWHTHQDIIVRENKSEEAFTHSPLLGCRIYITIKLGSGS
jgi:hypothetical protein